MRLHILFGAVLVSPLLTRGLQAQEPLDTEQRSIRQVAFRKSQVMGRLQYLCDRIGSRLTGSKGLAEATEWSKAQFAALGMEVKTDAWSIEHSWQRGAARARIVAPIEKRLTLAAGGWTPSTSGVVRAEVVDLSGRLGLKDLDQDIAGKIVITRRRAGELALAADPYAKAAVRLEFSDKPLALLGMDRLNLGGGVYAQGKLPSAFVIDEDLKLMQRFLAAGEAVEVEIEIDNTFGNQPVDVHNLYADLVGSRKGDIVFAGTQLDSWDLSAGAVDGAVGVAVLLEAARILKGLGVKPLRTIRFVLFAGEQQGSVGSRRYVLDHASELDAHQAGLVMNRGTGALVGVSLNFQDAYVALFEKWVMPVRDLDMQDLSYRPMPDGDQLAFQKAGVPAFSFIQEPVEFDVIAHSQADSFDKAVEGNLMQAAAVLASGLWTIANHPGDLPRFDPKQAERQKPRDK